LEYNIDIMNSSNKDDIVNALKNNYLFKSLTDNQLEDLAENVWLDRHKEGEIIVREGDYADTLHIVVKGGVNVTKADGQFLAYLGPGGFFGEMALFQESTCRSANCEANDSTVCAVVRKAVLEQFCDQHPEAGLKIYRIIIKTLSERLQATSADLAFLMGTQVKKQAKVDEMVSEAHKSKEG
jgi:CRP-like cAMP-binding protein